MTTTKENKIKFEAKNSRRKLSKDHSRQGLEARELRKNTITPGGRTLGAFGSLDPNDFNERALGTTGEPRHGKSKDDEG